MTVTEFSNEFDVLYNNISSNQAPGLNEYEKSLFLTKAQDEVIKNYFNAKGNAKQEGFDDSKKRQIDFSSLIRVAKTNREVGDYEATGSYYNRKPTYIKITEPYFKSIPYASTYLFEQVKDSNGNVVKDKNDNILYYRKSEDTEIYLNDAQYDFHENTRSVTMPNNVMFIINESVTVMRSDGIFNLVVIPINHSEYDLQMSKPYKRPLKNNAWRLINTENTNRLCDLIVGPNDDIIDYSIRYIKRPNPIILVGLDDGVTINGASGSSDCELDPILHEEILQRAVELAMTAWKGDPQLTIQTGARSE